MTLVSHELDMCSHKKSSRRALLRMVRIHTDGGASHSFRRILLREDSARFFKVEPGSPTGGD